MMAPLRSSRTRAGLNADYASTNTRRGAGGVIDHDPTEGLPVRKWEYKDVTVNQNPKQAEDNSAGGFMFPNENYPWSELPLPKDYDALPPHNQQLLRRARAGNTFMKKNNGNPSTNGAMQPPPNPAEATKPSSPAPEDPDLVQTSNHKALLDEDRAFTIRRWTPATRQDLPERTYLAPRRPGLPPLYGHHAYANGTVGTAAPVVDVKKKTVKLKKNDPETGDPKVYDVMIIEGTEHTIDGEIIPGDSSAPPPVANITSDPSKPESSPSTPVPVKHEQLTTESLAPGTVVEGVGVANEDGVIVAPAAAAALSKLSSNNAATPQQESNRRRPPPPKRKKFGPGRGKKGPMKKVVFEGEGGQMEAVGVTPSSQVTDEPGTEGAEGEVGGKEATNEDDNDNDNDGDEEDDEAEGSEDGETEGDLNDDHPMGLERATDAELSAPPPPQSSVAAPAPVTEPQPEPALPLDTIETPTEVPPAPVVPEPSALPGIPATAVEATPSDSPRPITPVENAPDSKAAEPADETADAVMADVAAANTSAAAPAGDIEPEKAASLDVPNEKPLESVKTEEPPGVADEMDLLGRLEEGIDEEGASRA